MTFITPYLQIFRSLPLRLLLCCDHSTIPVLDNDLHLAYVHVRITQAAFSYLYKIECGRSRPSSPWFATLQFTPLRSWKPSTASAFFMHGIGNTLLNSIVFIVTLNSLNCSDQRAVRLVMAIWTCQRNLTKYYSISIHSFYLFDIFLRRNSHSVFCSVQIFRNRC